MLTSTQVEQLTDKVHELVSDVGMLVENDEIPDICFKKGCTAGVAGVYSQEGGTRRPLNDRIQDKVGPITNRASANTDYTCAVSRCSGSQAGPIAKRPPEAGAEHPASVPFAVTSRA